MKPKIVAIIKPQPLFQRLWDEFKSRIRQAKPKDWRQIIRQIILKEIDHWPTGEEGCKQAALLAEQTWSDDEFRRQGQETKIAYEIVMVFGWELEYHELAKAAIHRINGYPFQIRAIFKYANRLWPPNHPQPVDQPCFDDLLSDPVFDLNFGFSSGAYVSMAEKAKEQQNDEKSGFFLGKAIDYAKKSLEHVDSFHTLDRDTVIQLGVLIFELGSADLEQLFAPKLESIQDRTAAVYEIATKLSQPMRDPRSRQRVIRFLDASSAGKDQCYVLARLVRNAINHNCNSAAIVFLNHLQRQVDLLTPAQTRFLYMVVVARNRITMGQLDYAHELADRLRKMPQAYPGENFKRYMLDFVGILFGLNKAAAAVRCLQTCFLGEHVSFSDLNLIRDYEEEPEILSFIERNKHHLLRRDAKHDTILESFVYYNRPGQYETAYLDLAKVLLHTDTYLELNSLVALGRNKRYPWITLRDFRCFVFLDQRMNPHIGYNPDVVSQFVETARRTRDLGEMAFLHKMYQTVSRVDLLTTDILNYFREWTGYNVAAIHLFFNEFEASQQIGWLQYFAMTRARGALRLINRVILEPYVPSGRMRLKEALWALSEIGFSGSPQVDHRVKQIAASLALPLEIRTQACAAYAALAEGAGKTDSAEVLLRLLTDLNKCRTLPKEVPTALALAYRYRVATEDWITVLTDIVAREGVGDAIQRQVAYLLSDLEHEKALFVALDIVNSPAFDAMDHQTLAHRSQYNGHYHAFLASPDFYLGRPMMRKKILTLLTEIYLRQNPSTQRGDQYRSRLTAIQAHPRYIKHNPRLPQPYVQSEPVLFRGIGGRAGQVYRSPSIRDLLTRGCQTTPILSSEDPYTVPWAKKGIVYTTNSLSCALRYSSLHREGVGGFGALIAIKGSFLHHDHSRLRSRFQKENQFHVAFNHGIPKSAIALVILPNRFEPDITLISKAEDGALGTLTWSSELFEGTTYEERFAIRASLRTGMRDKIVFVDLSGYASNPDQAESFFAQHLTDHGLREVSDEELIDASAAFSAARQAARRFYEEKHNDPLRFREVYQLLERLDDDVFYDQFDRIVARIGFEPEVQEKVLEQRPRFQDLITAGLEPKVRKAKRLLLLTAGLEPIEARGILEKRRERLNIPLDQSIESVLQTARESAVAAGSQVVWRVQKSVHNHRVVVQVPSNIEMGSLAEFQKNRLVVYKRLSDGVINQPYADGGKGLRVCNGYEILEAHRPNHGTLHSMRQGMYFDYIVAFFGLSFDEEMRELARLAVMLCRVGRTNEETHHLDPTYAGRSAQIFQLIANRIGCFSAELVDQFAKLIAYQPEDVPQANLAAVAIELAHRMDLYRCWDMNKADQYLEEHLETVFALDQHSPPRDIKETLPQLRHVSWVANYVTGNRLTCFQNQPSAGETQLAPLVNPFVSANRELCPDLFEEKMGSFGYREDRFVRLTKRVAEAHRLLDAVKANFLSD